MLLKKKCTAKRAVAALVRWQVVLVFLSSPVVLLCCPSRREEGGRSLLSVCTFFLLHPVDPVTGARASFCVWAVRRPRPCVLSLPISAGTDTGSSRDVTPLQNKRSRSEFEGWAGLSTDLKSRSLLMRHTYPRARLRGEQVLSWHQHADVSRCVCAATKH